MRRRLIVHPAYQFRFMLSFVMGILFIVGVLGGMGVYGIRELARENLLSPDQQALLLKKSEDLIFLVLAAGAVLISLFSFISLYLSFRVVGPLYRVEIWLERILEGFTPKPVKVRKRDELHSLVELLNRIFQKLHREE